MDIRIKKHFLFQDGSQVQGITGLMPILLLMAWVRYKFRSIFITHHTSPCVIGQIHIGEGTRKLVYFGQVKQHQKEFSVLMQFVGFKTAISALENGKSIMTDELKFKGIPRDLHRQPFNNCISSIKICFETIEDFEKLRSYYRQAFKKLNKKFVFCNKYVTEDTDAE